MLRGSTQKKRLILDNRVSLPTQSKILLLADIHGNWEALSAVAQAVPDFDALICLGDLVNFGPSPLECIEWIQKRVAVGLCLQGNHDRALATGQSSRCSVKESNLADQLRDQLVFELPKPQRLYLISLPQRFDLNLGDTLWRGFHALPTDPLCGYLLPHADDRFWRFEVEFAENPDVLLVAHSHRPFIKQLGHTTIVNPGSVGRPKDGDPRASYAIWQDGAFTLHRVPYDLESTQRKLRRMLPSDLADSLNRVLATGRRLPRQ